MPRKPRILIDGMAVHIVQRGVDRAATFFSPEDYLLNLKGSDPFMGQMSRDVMGRSLNAAFSLFV